MSPLHWGLHPHPHGNPHHPEGAQRNCQQISPLPASSVRGTVRQFCGPLGQWVNMHPSLLLVVTADHKHIRGSCVPGDKAKVEIQSILLMVTCYLKEDGGVLQTASGTEMGPFLLCPETDSAPQSLSLFLALPLSQEYIITNIFLCCLVDQNKLQLETRGLDQVLATSDIGDRNPLL